MWFRHCGGGMITGPSGALFTRCRDSSLLLYVEAIGHHHQPPPRPATGASPPLSSSAGDKERPINMMKRAIELRPSDSSSQTLVHRRSSVSVRMRGASSRAAATGNEMWNEMSRYNERPTPSLHLLFRSDAKSLEKLLLASRLPPFFPHFIITRQTSCFCLFTFLIFRFHT